MALPDRITRRAIAVKPRSGFELYAWYFTRISGLILIFMAVFHLLYMHFFVTVDKIDFNFIIDRWRSPFWRLWDFFLLVFGFTHGMNGVRVVFSDYILPGTLRDLINLGLFTVWLILLLAGASIIFTFQTL